ncbi:cystin-1-like [Pogoniulus pusillus]|uniref:cystin-1-like n=1 Tax=Pogoniulus pusillus TaxID=488313 RepID=UPI0030B97FD4
MGSGSSRRRRRAAANQELLAEGEKVLVALPTPGHQAGDTEEEAGGGGGTQPEQETLSSRSLPGPEDSSAAHQCALRSRGQPLGHTTVTYDCSEEELMASIEQEFCH